MILYLILLIIMIISAVWTVMARSLLKAAIGLAVVSVAITVLMFTLDSPLAAVFELSVCTGLITVIFLSTLSLTKPRSHQELVLATRYRLQKYWPLPVLIVLLGLMLPWLIKIPLNIRSNTSLLSEDARIVLWNTRQLDLFGQIIVLFGGAFGVLILFKGSKEK